MASSTLQEQYPNALPPLRPRALQEDLNAKRDLDPAEYARARLSNVADTWMGTLDPGLLQCCMMPGYVRSTGHQRRHAWPDNRTRFIAVTAGCLLSMATTASRLSLEHGRHSSLAVLAYFRAPTSRSELTPCWPMHTRSASNTVLCQAIILLGNLNRCFATSSPSPLALAHLSNRMPMAAAPVSSAERSPDAGSYLNPGRHWEWTSSSGTVLFDLGCCCCLLRTCVP